MRDKRTLKVETLCNWCRGRIVFEAPPGFTGVHANCSWCGKRVWLPVNDLRPIYGEDRRHNDKDEHPK